MKKARYRSYRDRYFENWQAEKVPTDNRKGYRMVYRYVGSFCSYAPADEKRTLAQEKRKMVLFELAGMVCYLSAMLSGTAFTRCKLASGFGVLSVALWLPELYGVIRFAADGEYMKSMTANEVDQCLRIGCIGHAALLALSVIAAAVQLFSEGTGGAGDILTALAVLACAVFSVLIRNTFSRLLMTTHKNVDGKPVP